MRTLSKDGVPSLFLWLHPGSRSPVATGASLRECAVPLYRAAWRVSGGQLIARRGAKFQYGRKPVGRCKTTMDLFDRNV
jgi:hypothetical protein